MKTAFFDTPLRLENGSVLPSVTVAYDTFGTLSPQGDNVIWICHALTADSNVAGWWPQYRQQPLSMLDVRDLGFDPLAGLIGLALAVAVIAWRRPALRQPLTISVMSGVTGIEKSAARKCGKRSRTALWMSLKGRRKKKETGRRRMRRRGTPSFPALFRRKGLCPAAGRTISPRWRRSTAWKKPWSVR